MLLVAVCGCSLGGAAALMAAAFRTSIVFFVAPSQLLGHPPAPDRTVRLGGMVVAGSVVRTEADGVPVARFAVTDGQAAVTVSYAGVLPDLFREGQSVVALGTVGADGRFTASEVLAKHSETYMPRDVADALRRAGKWDPRFGKPPADAAWAGMTGARGS
jgi:cytochrome c-type biogenesis protein CcmE